MGIELLEEKYQNYIKQCPQNVSRLETLARQVSLIQLDMRTLFDAVTPLFCKDCTAPCCKCMPVEGWFTESDYFLYRMLHEAPFDLRVTGGDGMSCAFLGPAGCLLPQDLRPFPCVKVNCKKVADEIELRGSIEAFNAMYAGLELLQDELWPLLADIHSCNVVQAQAL